METIIYKLTSNENRNHHTGFILGKKKTKFSSHNSCVTVLKTFTSVTYLHIPFIKVFSLSWDNNYGCLIVQELKRALVYQKFWLLIASQSVMKTT